MVKPIQRWLGAWAATIRNVPTGNVRKPGSMEVEREGCFIASCGAAGVAVIQGAEAECPDYRAVYSEGRLSLVRWHARLPGRHGPANPFIRRKNDTEARIADLIIDFADLYARELIVIEVHNLDDRFRHALLDWAGLLGYRRVWFPEGIVEPDEACAGTDEQVFTECLACHIEWRGAGQQFWAAARCNGLFPPHCPCCNHPLPQMSLVQPIEQTAGSCAAEPGSIYTLGASAGAVR